MELIFLLAILTLAIHQFWIGHKKDNAGNVKAGRVHMFVSIGLIIIGLWMLNALD